MVRYVITLNLAVGRNMKWMTASKYCSLIIYGVETG